MMNNKTELFVSREIAELLKEKDLMRCALPGTVITQNTF